MGTSDWLLAQSGEPFTLEIPGVPLEPGEPIRVAATASAQTTCEVQVVDERGQPAFESRVWEITPKQVFFLEQKLKPAPERKPYTVRATMRPKGDKPSMGFVITQDNVDSKRLQAMAAQVLFIDDPASAPGHFTLDIPLLSSVRTQIWRGEAARGVPLYSASTSNLVGLNPIPWNLVANGRRVPPGRYFAWLVGTPNDTKRRPTNYSASFAVK
jgi:hypothetical protein